MGPGVQVPLPIDGHRLRGQILLEEPLQRRLQLRAAPRDRIVVSVLAVAAGRQAPRRLRDAQRDHHGHGVVSQASYR
jgi:hypothetical protein